MCREKGILGIVLGAIAGSPLRVQGKVSENFINYQPPRITPACAGKRIFLVSTAYQFKDHPCVCREKKILIILIKFIIGSPLRVQGKVKIHNEKMEL